MKSKLKKNNLLISLDSRVKTVSILLSIFAASVLTHWYLSLILWISALALLFSIGIPIKKIIKRLSIPLGIAWLVFLSIIFTNGQTVIYNIPLGPVKLHLYSEGLYLGILILIRILSAVSLASLLAFSTDMTDILETLRICKVPNIIIDIAAMMYRYLYIIGDITNSMNRARASRMGNNRSWAEQISDTGKVAAYVLSKSLDRSVQIYNAMLSRGYNEDSKTPNYFQNSISKSHIYIGVLIISLLLCLLGINIIF